MGMGGLLAMRMRVGSGTLVQVCVGGLLAMRMRVGIGTLVQVCGGAAGHEDEGR